MTLRAVLEVLVTASSLVLTFPALAPAQATDLDRKGYVAAFHDLHSHLGHAYPAFKIKEIDWKQVGDELLPRVKDVTSDEEFGKLVLQLVARLEDSHAVVQPGTARVPQVDFPRYDPGFACLTDDRGRPVVYHVDEGSPAAEAGVKVGMTVASVNGKPVADAIGETMERLKTWSGYSSDRYLRYHATQMFPRQPRKGAEVKLVLEDVAGNPHAIAPPATLDVRYLPRRPVPVPGAEDAADVSWAKLADGIGYLYVRRIRNGLEDSIDKALRELGDMRGLVIDVRGNSGGGFDGRRAFRNFDPDDGQEPRRPRHVGPIALLLDERCISAGEGWASWFVARKRATTFGTATAGASSRKQTYTLTNGLYKVVVPVKAYNGFLDRPIERRGLEPDVPVRCNAKDLSEGKDTVLAAARAYLLRGQESAVHRPARGLSPWIARWRPGHPLQGRRKSFDVSPAAP